MYNCYYYYCISCAQQQSKVRVLFSLLLLYVVLPWSPFDAVEGADINIMIIIVVVMVPFCSAVSRFCAVCVIVYCIIRGAVDWRASLPAVRGATVLSVWDIGVPPIDGEQPGDTQQHPINSRFARRDRQICRSAAVVAVSIVHFFSFSSCSFCCDSYCCCGGPCRQLVLCRQRAFANTSHHQGDASSSHAMKSTAILSIDDGRISAGSSPVAAQQK